MLVTLPKVTLVLAGLCALLNLWLSLRVGQVRRAEKVFVGDGGNERVVRRMRSHLNFAENAPLVLILVLAIELSVGQSPWLWGAAALFVLARIGHGLGMDGWYLGRAAGTIVTFGLELALAVWAIALPFTAGHVRDVPAVETTVPQGVRKLLPLLLALLGAAPAPDTVSPERMSVDARVLASPAFEGRAPGTPGEERTVAWLVARFKAMGVQPGGPGGQWTQAVPLVHTRLGAGTISAGGVGWTQGREVYLSTVRPVDRVRIADAPMVFVGYGVRAPERGWDDFKGVDLHGKVAVFLVNDPDFQAAAGDDSAGKFGGRRMTYYGRWTYKYEEAARRGAVAALIVHDTPGAGYGWATVTAPGGENYDIVRRPGDERVPLQGWIEGGAAARLFAAAGLDLAAERARARRADFRPVELRGQRLNADFAVTTERARSRNVLAKVTGRTRPDEVVMFGAHWDAYGIGPADARGRTMRPGANDDGLGVAAVLEAARAFAHGPKPDRTVVFALWTGEERGLLGSETYAQHPVYPAAKTVANLTFDILQTAGPSRDVLLVGPGQNALEDGFAAAIAAQGRVVTPEALPERGLFYRADHFSLARQGVPTLLLMAISGAPDLVAGGRPGGQAWLDAYMRCYHQTCDEWSPAWDLRGAARDVAAMLAVGRRLADSGDWPAWREGSEFKAVRDASAAARR